MADNSDRHWNGIKFIADPQFIYKTYVEELDSNIVIALSAINYKEKKVVISVVFSHKERDLILDSMVAEIDINKVSEDSIEAETINFRVDDIVDICVCGYKLVQESKAKSVDPKYVN